MNRIVKKFKTKIIFITLFSMILIPGLVPPSKIESTPLLMNTPNYGLDINSAINIISPEERNYTGPMSGYYPATFGFENDDVGDYPAGWYVYEGNSTKISVYDNSTSINNEHKKILALKDNSISNYTSASQEFDENITSGTVEFWVMSSDTSKGTVMVLDRVSDTLTSDPLGKITLLIKNNTLYYWCHNYTDTGFSVEDNVWYHISIDFMLEVVSDDIPPYGIINVTEITYTVRVNDGILIQRFGLQVTSNPFPYFSRLWVTTVAEHAQYLSFFDAIGYSWDPKYYVGDNLKEGLLLDFEPDDMNGMEYSLDGSMRYPILGDTVIPLPDYGDHTIQVFADGYDPGTRHFTIPINIISPGERTYYSPMSGYYPATFGFENDDVGDYPEAWHVYEGIRTMISVWDDSESINNEHKKILAIGDHSNSDYASASQLFDENIANGTVEFWVKSSDASKGTEIVLDRVSDISDPPTSESYGKIALLIENNTLYYIGDYFIPYIDTGYTIEDNVWYHISIDFMFDFLYEETVYVPPVDIYQLNYSLRVNGELLIQVPYFMFPFWLLPYFNRLWFSTRGEDAWCLSFFDAIGYSWDPTYNVGDNLNEGLLLDFEPDDLDEMEYSLDGAMRVSILGDTVIPLPDYGDHTIQVFADGYPPGTRHFTIAINILSPEEGRTYYSGRIGYYPATFGFESDAFGDYPAGWYVYEGTQTKIRVWDDSVSMNNAHKKILVLDDYSESDFAIACQPFDGGKPSGTVEFWVMSSDTSKLTLIVLDNTIGDIKIQLAIYNKWLYYLDANNNWINTEFSVNDNVWYHVSIDFIVGFSITYAEFYYSYIVRVNDEQLICVPHILLGPDDTPSYFNRLWFSTIAEHTEYCSFFDAIGYSWDPKYNIGDNLHEGLFLDLEPDDLPGMEYSLDGAMRVPILGDTVIPLPDYGNHTLQVFAEGYPTGIRHFTIAINILSPEEGRIYYNPTSGYDGLLLDLEPDDLPGMEYSLDGEMRVPISGDTVIQLPDYGSHTLQVFAEGYDPWTRHFLTADVPNDLNYTGPSLIGATDRYFPQIGEAKLGFTINTGINPYTDPKISFGITNKGPSGSNNISVKVDMVCIWEATIERNHPYEFTIDAPLLENLGTHQIILELSNGTEYKLEYLWISNLNFTESELYENLQYTPAQFYYFSDQYDNALVSISSRFVNAHPDLTTDAFGPQFVACMTAHLNPDIYDREYINPPLIPPTYDSDPPPLGSYNPEDYFVHDYYYIHAMKIRYEVIDVYGNLVDLTDENSAPEVYPSYQGNTSSIEMNYLIDYILYAVDAGVEIAAALLPNIAWIPYIGWMLLLLEGLMLLAPDADIAGCSSELTETYGEGLWHAGSDSSQAGIGEPLIYGHYPVPELLNASMKVTLPVQLPAGEFGNYQVRITWTLITKVYSKSICDLIHSIYDGFTISNTYYFNFEVTP